MRRSLILIVAALAAGCGSAETLPPQAGGGPGLVTSLGGDATLDPRARVVRLGDETAAAGVGPTHIAETDDHVYVTDTAQDALLVFRKVPELILQRRDYLAGAPTAMVVDERNERLRVTLSATGETVLLTLDGTPAERARYRLQP